MILTRLLTTDQYRFSLESIHEEPFIRVYERYKKKFYRVPIQNSFDGIIKGIEVYITDTEKLLAEFRSEVLRSGFKDALTKSYRRGLPKTLTKLELKKIVDSLKVYKKRVITEREAEDAHK